MTSARISLLLFVLIFSSFSSAGPEVSLIFSATSGTGITGTNTIRAKAGEKLTLDIIVKDTGGGGFCSVAASLSWDAGHLTGGNARTCPSPPYTTAGICTDTVDAFENPFPYLRSTTPPIETAGSATGFSASWPPTCAFGTGGYGGPFRSQSMLLGRTTLYVNIDGTSTINLVNPNICVPTANVGCYAYTSATATATVQPPGC
jgi:hypothetical protein